MSVSCGVLGGSLSLDLDFRRFLPATDSKTSRNTSYSVTVHGHPKHHTVHNPFLVVFTCTVVIIYLIVTLLCRVGDGDVDESFHVTYFHMNLPTSELLDVDITEAFSTHNSR